MTKLPYYFVFPRSGKTPASIITPLPLFVCLRLLGTTPTPGANSQLEPLSRRRSYHPPPGPRRLICNINNSVDSMGDKWQQGEGGRGGEEGKEREKGEDKEKEKEKERREMWSTD
eukprot:762769-Hanusia_phi.AAC.1